MIPASLDGLSLRQLRLFDAVYRTRNLSHAADELGTSQPSVSLSLDRLRGLFGDPLFVRVGARMEPTPRAEVLNEGVRAIFAVAADYFVGRAAFDAATAVRRFTVHMTDPAETILMPRLVARIAASSPRVGLRIAAIGPDSQAMLADGGVDLIVGFLAREGAQLAQAKLHDEHFVGIARTGHPRIGVTVTAADLAGEARVVIAGTGHVDTRPGTSPIVALEVSTYFAAGAAVAETDLVAIVPARVGAHLAARGAIRVFALPAALPDFQVRQYWHPRFHHDAGHQWLRKTLLDVVDR